MTNYQKLTDDDKAAIAFHNQCEYPASFLKCTLIASDHKARTITLCPRDRGRFGSTWFTMPFDLLDDIHRYYHP